MALGVGDYILCRERKEAIVTSIKTGKTRWIRHRHIGEDYSGKEDDSCAERHCMLTQKKGKRNMITKKVWEITVINKKTEKVLVDRKMIIDGCNEGDVKMKAGISFSDILKDILFDNLAFFVREVGTFDQKEKKEKDED